MTDKSDDRVGHLNTILARGGGNLNDPIFKSSNSRALPGGGGMLKFRIDWRMIALKLEITGVPARDVTDRLSEICHFKVKKQFY